MEDTGAAQFDNATVDSALRKAINEQDVNAVRRLLATPGYRYPATPGPRHSCADLSLMHRLFLLRDDALFLRCLEYCWFLDPWRRYPSETDYRRVFETAATSES